MEEIQAEAEWKLKCPDGGELLRLLVCSGTKGVELPATWSAGRLFVSESGLVFESSDEDVDFQRKLLLWGSVISVQRVREHRRGDFCWGGQLLVFSSVGLNMRIQLSSAESAAWFEQTWLGYAQRRLELQRLLHGKGEDVAQGRGPGRDAELSAGLSEGEDQVAAGAARAGRRRSSYVRAKEERSWQQRALYASVDAELGPAAAPAGEQPIFEADLPDIGIGAVRKMYEADDWIPSKV